MDKQDECIATYIVSVCHITQAHWPKYICNKMNLQHGIVVPTANFSCCKIGPTYQMAVASMLVLQARPNVGPTTY